MIQFKLYILGQFPVKHTFFSVTVMVALIATISAVAAMETISEAEALKGKGVYNGQYGSATKGIVCGDRLCSEVEKEQTTKSSGESHTKTESSITTIPSSASTQVGKEVSIDSIMGATIKNTEIDKQSGIVIVSIDAQDDGMVMLNLDSTINDIFMVIVDGEEWDDAYIDEENTMMEIHFYAGTEKIEILGSILG